MTREMTISLAALVTAALFAGSASAVPITLDDAQWGSMDIATPNPYFVGTITGSDIAGDPGYNWDMNVVKPTGSPYPYGLLNIGAETSTMGLTVTPGDEWSVEFENPMASAYMGVLLTAYVVDGSGTSRWVSQPYADPAETIITAGQTKTVSWDLLSGIDPSTQTGVAISSISQLGLTFIGDADGGGEALSLQVIPEPATLAMVGLFGGGLLVVRRLFSI